MISQDRSAEDGGGRSQLPLKHIGCQSQCPGCMSKELRQIANSAKVELQGSHSQAAQTAEGLSIEDHSPGAKGAIEQENRNVKTLIRIARYYRRKSLHGAADLLEAISDSHGRMIAGTDLAVELKGQNVRPEAIRTLTKLNLAFLRGVTARFGDAADLIRTEEALAKTQKQAWLERALRFMLIMKKPQLFQDLKDREQRLIRDLKVPIRAHGSNLVLLPGLNATEIAAISALPGLPEIRHPADLFAYLFIMTGSGFGAIKQYHRQKKMYRLTDELNGGAEYLGSARGKRNTLSAIIRMENFSRQVNERLLDQETLQRSANTANRIFGALVKAFGNPSREDSLTGKTLFDLKAGNKCQVLGFATDKESEISRLSALGFYQGAIVEIIRNNYYYPMQVQVGGAVYGLGFSIARQILVVPIEAETTV